MAGSSGHFGFRGPVFVVGLSRSGTKLLRDILNRHSLIAIPQSESFFIPRLLEGSSENRVPKDPRVCRATQRFLRRTGFYRNLALRGRKPSDEVLAELVAQNSWPETIEAVFRFYIDDPKRIKIWGDKTPTYLGHMLLLKRHFPEARFLHIYRDPRDRVVSAYNAWGANIFVAAQEWHKGMQAAINQAAEMGSSLHAVAYENLTAQPERELRQICEFLDVDFQSEMLKLDRPVEQRGDPDHPTRTSSRILASNAGSYREKLTAAQLARIESLVFPLAGQLGYESRTGVMRTRRLNCAERLIFYPPHYLNGLNLHIRRWGFSRGMRQALLRFRL